ncbi:MAG TPA: methylmalonyl-CoA mutase family protein [Dehalococcoidia bacterium]|nr:methylmalonyl-CoA mutase family protein [Dehalococcoidia bacterium]
MSENGNLKRIAEEQKSWQETTLKKALERGPERSDSDFRTSSTDTKPLYTPADTADIDYNRDVGYPGEYPYTRGIQPTMYRGRLWSIRQYAGYGTPEETNQRFKFLLSEGQPGLSVAFDLPTQLGYDSDDEMSLGEVGKVGVAIDTLADMETMFDGIPLDQVSTSMTINAPAAVLVAMYAVVGQKQGVPQDRIAGTAQNDVLKEYVARGTYIYPPRPSLRLAADLMAYCAKELPRFNSISISGYHIRDAGSTAVQEMAFTFANAIAYIEAALDRGLEIDDFASRISWIFNTQNNFLEEVAKYRALRRMWAKIMRERFGARDARSWMFRTHVQTGGATLTAQQPEVNIVRAALQALASVLGGVQSLALSCYDEALALPTEEAQRIAVRTQQVVAYESGVTDTADPLAGSYYIEWLTSELEKKAWEYLNRIEDMGGAVTAIESGYIQREIQEASYAYQKAVDEGKKVIVGVNKFRLEDEEPQVIFRVNPETERAQLKRLKAVKSERDEAAARAALARLGEVCRDGGSTGRSTGENLMHPIVEAVKAYATLGEICGVMREVFGDYRAPTAV